MIICSGRDDSGGSMCLVNSWVGIGCTSSARCCDPDREIGGLGASSGEPLLSEPTTIEDLLVLTTRRLFNGGAVAVEAERDGAMSLSESSSWSAAVGVTDRSSLSGILPFASKVLAFLIAFKSFFPEYEYFLGRGRLRAVESLVRDL